LWLKKDECSLHEPFFGQVQCGPLYGKHANSGGTYSCIFINFALILRPFAEDILFYFWIKTNLHFIPRKLSSKPNARGKVRNNKHKTIPY
jgi:hypothetical protein